jgi:hypothetical protein
LHLTIHIGPHKTGTTALQTAFAGGARALVRAGVLYPRVCWHHPAQHRLAFAGKRRALPGRGGVPDFETELARLAVALRRSRADRALISSEEFFAWPETAIARLAELPVDRITVATFLRRPDDFLVSCFNQKVRQPGNGFALPIGRFVRDPRAIAPEIDYAACLGRWADAFGEAAILLGIYEDGPPLPRMLAHLGLPGDFLPNPPDVNRSVAGAVAECLRHAKVAGLPEGVQRKLLKRAVEVLGCGAPYHLPAGDRRAVLAALEPANDALFRRFGRANPFVPVLVTGDGEERSNLTHADLMRLIGELI